MPSFELLDSEMLLEGRAFNIRRDRLKTPDGRETKFEIVVHSGSVVVVPVDHQGNLLFVRQYRHAAGASLLELPAGTREDDESYEACAAREIREETGMAAGRLERAGEFFLAPGYSTEAMVVFLATELTPSPLSGDADEFLEVERIPADRAMQMAEQGQVPDAKSLAALFLLRHSLTKHSGTNRKDVTV
jgi:ADP-ribose pyrophosphatase